MARENENDGRALGVPGGSVAPTSGVQLPMICCKLLISYSVAGNLTFRTLDGNNTATVAMAVGTYVIDVQFDMVTWTGTATAAAFYRF